MVIIFLNWDKLFKTGGDPYLSYEQQPSKGIAYKYFKVHARTFEGDTIVINEGDHDLIALKDTLDWGSPVRPIRFEVDYEDDIYVVSLMVTNEHDIWSYEILRSFDGERWDRMADIRAKNRLTMSRYTIVY